jgi:signal peptidase I
MKTMKSTTKTIIRELLITLALAVAIFFLLQFTVQSSIVVGSSMEPGIQNGDRLLVSKIVFRFGDPRRGDIIILRAPVSYPVDYIKRVIGLPGDKIEIKNGKVSVNDIPLDEPYIKDIPRYVFGPYTVPADSYFVMGDNRNASNDSHVFGAISSDRIIGRAWIGIWPPSNWGSLGNYPLNKQVEGK